MGRAGYAGGRVSMEQPPAKRVDAASTQWMGPIVLNIVWPPNERSCDGINAVGRRLIHGGGTARHSFVATVARVWNGIEYDGMARQDDVDAGRRAGSRFRAPRASADGLLPRQSR